MPNFSVEMSNDMVFTSGADLQVGIGLHVNSTFTGGKGFLDGFANSATLTVDFKATAVANMGMSALNDLPTTITLKVLQLLAQQILSFLISSQYLGIG